MVEAVHGGWASSDGNIWSTQAEAESADLNPIPGEPKTMNWYDKLEASYNDAGMNKLVSFRGYLIGWCFILAGLYPFMKFIGIF